MDLSDFFEKRIIRMKSILEQTTTKIIQKEMNKMKKDLNKEFFGQFKDFK